MKNYKLDQTLLPNIWLTWLTKDGRIWANPNGKRQNHPEEWMYYDRESDINCYRCYDGRTPIGSTWQTKGKMNLWVKAGSQLYYAYAKYHEDIDRLELAAVIYDTTRGDHKHEWSFDGDRFFIGKDKSVINQDGVLCTTEFNVKRRCIVARAKDMISAILRLNTNDAFLQEFKKFIGRDYYTIGNGTSVTSQWPWHLSKWYLSKQKVRTKGKTQEFTDKLVAMPLGEIEHLSYKYKPRVISPQYGSDETIKNIIYFERIDNEWSVLRALFRNENDTFEEIWRVYLNDDGTNRIVSKSDDDWVPSSQPISWHTRSKCYFANLAEAEEKCNRIKYICPIVEGELSDYVDYMITTLRFPEIEQLYKMGYRKIANSIARSNTPKATIKEKFGGYYNEKESNVLRKVGMTKYQLDKYNEMLNKENSHWGHGNRVLETMRKTLGNDLSHTDNATYDEYLIAIDELLHNFWSMSYINDLEMDQSKFWKNLVRLSKKHHNVCNIVNDTISVYHRLDRGTEPAIDWIFDSYSDVVRAHDAITALRNEQERERRAYYNMAEAERRKKDEESRRKVDEKRKCYEYEDEEFIIRLPKSVNEIVSEGTKQRICIGGYTTRHSKGETNLFFLRRKSDEDTPFYAIEMANNKNIVQIHGYCNRWLGNNPEAIPTVIRWLRKNGIKCADTILTFKSTGYSSKNDYVPMPVVD